MPSLRVSITSALRRGVINPIQGDISLLHLAFHNLQGAPPLSVRNLIRTLDSLQPPPPPPRPEPPKPPPPSTATRPNISVSFRGSITDAQFTVTGSGFLPNLPATGIAIRVVDANVGIETRRETTSSSGAGQIEHIITGDLSGLVVNALGIATIAFSATDGRPDRNDLTGFLWSNTVRINFP